MEEQVASGQQATASVLGQKCGAGDLHRLRNRRSGCLGCTRPHKGNASTPANMRRSTHKDPHLCMNIEKKHPYINENRAEENQLTGAPLPLAKMSGQNLGAEAAGANLVIRSSAASCIRSPAHSHPHRTNRSLHPSVPAAKFSGRVEPCLRQSRSSLGSPR